MHHPIIWPLYDDFGYFYKLKNSISSIDWNTCITWRNALLGYYDLPFKIQRWFSPRSNATRTTRDNVSEASSDPFPQDVHYMRSARTQFLASFLRRCLRFWLDFRHQHFECRYFEIGFLLYNEIQIVYLYSLSMSPIMCFSDRTRGKKMYSWAKTRCTSRRQYRWTVLNYYFFF